MALGRSTPQLAERAAHERVPRVRREQLRFAVPEIAVDIYYYSLACGSVVTVDMGTVHIFRQLFRTHCTVG